MFNEMGKNTPFSNIARGVRVLKRTQFRVFVHARGLLLKRGETSFGYQYHYVR